MMRTRAAVGVVVELTGMFRITANAVPITEEDSRAHTYGLRDGDCLAHLDLAFKFYSPHRRRARRAGGRRTGAAT